MNQQAILKLFGNAVSHIISEDCPHDLADIVGFGHSIIMYGRDIMLKEFAALLDGPVDAGLICFFGCLCLTHQADKFLRNVNVEGTRKQVNLLLRRDGFEAGNDGNGDASLST